MQSELVKPKTTFGNKIKFTPYAWAKLLYMRDRGETEVAGYGVTETEDPLLVTDFVLVKQECTVVTFDLDAADSAEYMEKMMDKGLMPWQYANILIHTHPGDSPSPSGVDEKNFISAFSHPNWAIMFIIAEGGNCYCRLKVNVGPGSIVELKTVIDWETKFGGTDKQAWEEEYKTKVMEQLVSPMRMTGKEGKKGNVANSFQGYDDLYPDLNDPLWHNKKEQQSKQLSCLEQDEFDSLGKEAYEIDYEIDFDCHWDSNGDVAYWDEMTCQWYFFDPICGQWYVEKEDDDTIVIKIDTPKNKEWVLKIVNWAIEFADERVVEEVTK